MIFQVFHGAQDKIVLVFDKLVALTRPFHHRILMPGIGACHFSGTEVNNAQPYGDKHIFKVLIAYSCIDIRQNLRR